MLTVTDTQQMIIETAEKIAKAYGPEYWQKCDDDEIYPADFVNELGAQGFFGLAVPEAMGGSGQGMTELCLAMEALCRGGGGGGPALGYLFGLLGTLTLVKSASTQQADHYLAPFARGEKICAFALSEPDAGTNSFNIKTTAVAEAGGFRINGNLSARTRLLYPSIERIHVLNQFIFGFARRNDRRLFFRFTCPKSTLKFGHKALELLFFNKADYGVRIGVFDSKFTHRNFNRHILL